MKEKIGIIGFGNMGSVIAEKLKSNYKILLFDKDKDKTKNLLDFEISESNKDLAMKADIVILAVKPQDFDIVLEEIREVVNRKLVVSIAAGITTTYIEKFLDKAKVIRIMPNLAVKVGKGVICLCKGKSSSQKDLNFIKELFENMGKTLILNEDMMDKATAISGSGLGYYYDLIQIQKININELKEFEEDYFIPLLSLAAERLGFTPEQAKILARNTAEGSRSLLELSNSSPKELFKKIASKGGTTQAGSEVLHKGGNLIEAVEAALKRAEELKR